MLVVEQVSKTTTKVSTTLPKGYSNTNITWPLPIAGDLGAVDEEGRGIAVGLDAQRIGGAGQCLDRGRIDVGGDGAEPPAILLPRDPELAVVENAELEIGAVVLTPEQYTRAEHGLLALRPHRLRQMSASFTVKVTFRLDCMSSGGSLKVKAPSFTSTVSLIDQPPASSWNLSSKTISDPSQALARHAGTATLNSRTTSSNKRLDMDGPR